MRASNWFNGRTNSAFTIISFGTMRWCNPVVTPTEVWMRGVVDTVV
jgi:hypothetical protein